MSEQLLRTAQDSIDFLRRALIQRDAIFCEQRAEIERLRAEVAALVQAKFSVVVEVERLTDERDRLRAALAGEVGLVELLVSRAELRAERDEILSNHRHSEAREALRGAGGENEGGRQ